MGLTVGTKVRLKKAFANFGVGTIGFVYENYGSGASIIFKSGFYDGWDNKMSKEYFEDLGEDSRYTAYQFQNVFQVWEDFKAGYWNFTTEEG